MNEPSDVVASDPAEARHPARIYVFFAAFWSGFFVMTLEILGGRTLAPYFGTGVHVWGSVIFVFMLALSIGYLAGGHLSRCEARTTRVGQMLIAAGLMTLPGMIVGARALEVLEASGLDPRYAAVIGAGFLFLAPTTLWGMVSPYAVRLLVRHAALSGESAGRLYFVSTAGSSAGTLLTSFYFVLWFDVDTILIGLVSASVLTGVIAFLVDPGPIAARRETAVAVHGEQHLRSGDAQEGGGV